MPALLLTLSFLSGLALSSCSIRMDFEQTPLASGAASELTVVLSSQNSSPTSQSPIVVTATFGSPVDRMDASDVILGNSSLVDVASSDNTTFTLRITPTSEGVVTVDIPANVVFDSEGMGNKKATQLKILYAFAQSPTISEVSDQFIDQDTSTAALAFTISDEDSNLSCSTSVSMTSSNTTLINQSDAIFDGSAPNCTVTLTPNTSAFGTSEITLTVSDGELSSSESFDLEVTRTGWYQEAYIKASNAEEDDWFGRSLDINEDTLAIGAWYEDSSQVTITNGITSSVDNSASLSGAVYIYQRTGSSWEQQAYLKASNANSSDRFGSCVSISSETLAVCAPREESNQTSITNGTGSSSNNDANNSGAVYLYNRTGSSWQQQAYIKASNAETDDQFGSSISLTGNSLAVGATHEDSNQTTITNGVGSSSNNSLVFAGATYVYSRFGTTWQQQAYIKASNAETADLFGSSLSLSGEILVVGAPGEDSNQSNITNGTGSSSDNSEGGSGAVYIYQRTGTSWQQQAYVKATNADASDNFGNSVSVSGKSIAVGAFGEDSNQSNVTNGTSSSSNNSAFDNAGAVYIYHQTGSIWQQQAYIKASNAEANDYFGISISLNGDTLAVGATGESSNQVSITNGLGSSSNNFASNAGAVYIYKRSGNNWQQEAYIKASNAETGDSFGDSVSVSGDTVVVGTTSEDSNQTSITNGEGSSSDNSASSAGAVYVYRNLGRLFEVSELFGTVTSNSITLNWTRPGGKAIGYFIAYNSGAAAPADCSSGTQINITNQDTTTHTEFSLLAGTQYSFRICPYDRDGNYSDGMVYRFTTAP